MERDKGCSVAGAVALSAPAEKKPQIVRGRIELNMKGKEVLGEVVVGVREAECDWSKHEEIEGGGGVAL